MGYVYFHDYQYFSSSWNIIVLATQAFNEWKLKANHSTGRGLIPLNPLTAGVAYIRVFIFNKHIKYHLLNMLKIKCDINLQDLKTAVLHFVKSE